MKKTFNMEKEIKQLTEENERLSFQIKDLSIKNDFKSKAEQLEKTVKTLQSEKENFEQEIEEIKHSNTVQRTERKNQFRTEHNKQRIKSKKFSIGRKTKRNPIAA